MKIGLGCVGMSNENVTIERIVAGGDGMARLADGRVIFIGGTITGERVRVEITTNKKDYAPGFTGYTSGYGGYGGYLNGYGPSFWNPRYYYYTNYGQGFPSGG